MIRSTGLPLLPGYSINFNVGQTRFHKSQHLELLGKEVPYLSEKALPGIGGVPLPNSEINRFPSVYARGEVTELPTWIVYNKETLCFFAYYKEKLAQPCSYVNHIIHKCKIYYYLEDGTIQVFETPIKNSGIPQGCIIRRQKIKLPTAGNTANFYDILDLNIGREIDIFGKLFMITDCDQFTRNFLNRLGINVPLPLDTPNDPYEIERQKLERKQQKETVKNKVLKNLLQIDNRILTFDAYWDDSDSYQGFLHKLKIRYYLADDTIDMKDVTDPDNSYMILKRGKILKDAQSLIPMPGEDETETILNVLGTSVDKSRKLMDPLRKGIPDKTYYTDRDFRLGATIYTHGRKVVITDMDKFTKNYYTIRYDLDDLNPVEIPKTKEELAMEKVQSIRPKTPPYNGFGDYEDSMKSVKFLVPSDKVSPWRIDPEKEPYGYESKILRFGANLIENDALNHERKFIIRYYLIDDTISVYEIPFANSGREGGNIIKRRKIPVFGQEPFKSAPPETVSVHEFYIGNIVNLDNFKFMLLETDEYTIRYMELHPNVFIKSNVRYILNKVREAVRGDYKKWATPFVQKHGLVPFHEYRNSIKEALGNDISEHEILALGRHFREDPHSVKWNKDSLRTMVHDELRRMLYDDFQRLQENFMHFDPSRKGSIPAKEAYSILRGAKLPIPNDLLLIILDMFSFIEKEDETHIIRYPELIDYFNYKKSQVPSGYRTDFGEGFGMARILPAPVQAKGFFVNAMKLLEELNLEDELRK